MEVKEIPIEQLKEAEYNPRQMTKEQVDLFLGSGPTLIACEKTNRICYGMEIEPKYVDVIIKRWELFTNQKAIKI